MWLDINANVPELNIAQSKCVRGKKTKQLTSHCKGCGGGGKEMITPLNLRINCKSGKLIRGECGEYVELSNAHLPSPVAMKTQECGLDKNG